MLSRSLLFLLGCAATLSAQETATLSGQVVDPKGAAVPGTTITVKDLRRSSLKSVTANGTGLFQFDSLDPGDYSLAAEKAEFAAFRINLITLQARDRKSVRVALQLASTTTTVTVEAQQEGVSSDASGGAVLEQDFLKHLPLNGRNVSGLLQMAPGVVSGSGPGGGGINVNGLRSNTNYYMLDGVSVAAGTPIGGGGVGGPGGPGGGGPPAGAGAGGGGADAIPLDSLQEVRIQTSAFAPEFGRTPGAQISMSSRGGGNQLHGSAYEYFRNHHLNANDWFANRAGLARGRMSQHQFGGTVGGRIIANRTFFFLSGEMLKLRAPDTIVASLPDLTTRRSARANLRPYLNAFPLPNGPRQDGGAAQFNAVYTNPQDRESWNGRIDHTINAKNTGFVRYSFSPLESTQRGSGFISPNALLEQRSRAHSGTVSLISSLNVYSTNDLRVNYSRNAFRVVGYSDTFGGAVPLTDSQIFPRGVTSADASYNLAILGLSSLLHSQRTRSQQTQFNIVDGLTIIAGTHTYKMGVDFRTLDSTNYNPAYSVNAVFSGLSGQSQSFLSGTSATTVVSSSLPEVYPSTLNFSYYLQDTWRVDQFTTISYGLRWDVNPAPTARQGPRPLALSSNRTDRVTQTESLYNTRWTDLAPRFGLSHVISRQPGREVVFRGGIGIFHDLGYGTSLAAFSSAPYVNARTLTAAAYPLTTSDLAPPVLPATKPYNQVGAANRNLQSPRVWQWNATIEPNLGFGQLFSVGYAGTRGTRLLRTETTPSFSEDYDLLRLATNGADSDYHSLQAQFRRRFASRLLLQASYTWSHSIDTASADAGFGGGFATLFSSERGSSDYDVRHNFNLSGSYALPATKFLSALTKDWWTDFLFATRTGMPFDVVGLSADSSNQTATTPLRRGLFAQVRPNYNGQAVWISDALAPGGRRLNRDAFTSPTGFGQGNLGRNAIRGFGLTQLDLTLRREVRLGEKRSLHITAQGFNIFNQTNFANLTRNEGANLTSANFGIANRTQNQGVAGGLGAVFRTGGPRSVQLALRFQF
ncbi:MAG: carboxypeptidase-like regulatory domain-containing protein [Bryobacteraceae bacterium]|nr:carboxypeptidase-like regulatory domain-containing protein [Bryobacteraceae bacterium]